MVEVTLLTCLTSLMGGIILAVLKKILITLPDSLLKEVDALASLEKMNRSELARQAMRLYVNHKQKIKTRDRMKKGYEEMAQINRKLAEFCLGIDNELEKKYEDLLAESE